MRKSEGAALGAAVVDNCGAGFVTNGTDFEATITVYGLPWRFGAVVRADGQHVGLTLSRSPPPSWDGSLDYQLAMEATAGDGLDLVMDANALGVGCCIASAWDAGAIGERLESMVSAAKAIWLDADCDR